MQKLTEKKNVYISKAEEPIGVFYLLRVNNDINVYHNKKCEWGNQINTNDVNVVNMTIPKFQKINMFVVNFEWAEENKDHERIDWKLCKVKSHTTIPKRKNCIYICSFFSLFTNNQNPPYNGILSVSPLLWWAFTVSFSRVSSVSSMSNPAERPQVQVPHFPKVSLPTTASLLGTTLFLYHQNNQV